MSNSFFDFDLMAIPSGTNDQYSPKGAGQSKVLVVSYFPPSTQEEDYAFLENILKAVKLTPLEDKIHLISVSDNKAQLSLVNISKSLGVDYVLIFGIDLPSLGVRAQLPPYQFMKIGALNILAGHSLESIRIDRAAGKNQKAAALWQGLKSTFLS